MSGDQDIAELGAERSDKGAQKRKEGLAIFSVEQAMGVFMKESVGVYLQQKNNEHIGVATRQEIKEWAKEDLGNLLNGLLDKASGPKKEEIQKAVSFMRENLDTYITKLDDNLSKKRDAFLQAQGNIKPNGLAKDNAMVKVAQSSSYAKAGEELSSGNLDANNPKKDVTLKRFKAKVLETISGVYKMFGKEKESDEYLKLAQAERTQARVSVMKKMFKISEEGVKEKDSKGRGAIASLKKAIGMSR